jgi:hypothetical protein
VSTQVVFEIHTDDAELSELREWIAGLPARENLEVVGQLMVYVGTMFVAKAARMAGREAAFAHNRRTPR